MAVQMKDVTVLFDEQQIRERISQIGRQINADYGGQEVLVVGILKGAFIFMADLVRELELPVKIDFLQVSSYGKATISSGEIHIKKKLDDAIEGKHVLIVEDIIDTGITLSRICEILQTRNPASLKICCLLDKPSRRQVTTIRPDYVGFSIDDHFVVGWGLDYDQQYRQLPVVGILDPSVYTK
ncbi:MAG: hypoxanthine phosphoribosyltransferase [Syntrophomonadaceae bacterium]|nr:hypoxanthine phosphoribosyltransferase [Syntrophomonadaceae bacterium]